MTFALILIALFLYAAAAGLIWRFPQGQVALERSLAIGAIVLHGGVLGHQTLGGGAMHIGISEAASLFTLQSALLLWLLSWKEPLRSLGLAIYPLAAIAAVWAAAMPTPLEGTPITDWELRWHIVLSLFSAGLLTIAAMQAGALALQDRLLHRHELTRLLLRGMPPLQTMERLLFQLIAIGFMLLSLTLLSGLGFLHNWFAQHLAHKTILSISAWLIFGVLLWGRWRHGWRGRTAISWTLAGYAVLILAYFGSKLVLEQFLGERWT
ncbi:MAG TPA: cytochrome c biogenesis protein CcsA [Solimonas sp.]|nr:cytochrome c biogenesis protein CcsA [Solimonas sp.]